MMKSKADDHDEYNICNVCPFKNSSGGRYGAVCRVYITLVRVSAHYRNTNLASSNNTPPITTNKTTPRAQRLIGLLFAIISWCEGFTAFLPDRTALAN